MFAFAKKLFEPRKRVPARRRQATRPGLEMLEDRLVMTVANPLGATSLLSINPVGLGAAQTQPIVRTNPPPVTTATLSPDGTTLTINCAPSRTVKLQSDGSGHIQVIDHQNGGTGLVGQFTFSTINTVNITGDPTRTSNVQIDASNGMPFAAGTTVSASGGGAVLSLGAGSPIQGNEKVDVGGAHLDNITFSGVGIDAIPITGTLDIQTSALHPTVGFFGPGTLSAPASDGPAGFFYSWANKHNVTLDELAPGANVTLNETAAAPGELVFEVNMFGNQDTTTIASTPSGVLTEVTSTTAVGVLRELTSGTAVVPGPPAALTAVVNVQTNNGQVEIFGNSATTVNVGQPQSNGQYSTKGINADVSVSTAEFLNVEDTANGLPRGSVTVANDVISSVDGLFGNDAVFVSFSNVPLVLVVWQDCGCVQTLDVRQSGTGHPVTGTSTTTAPSTAGFTAEVYVGSGSQHSLHEYKLTPRLAAELPIDPADGLASLGLPSAVVHAFLAGGVTSQKA
jgi:hypothetical protein